MSDKFASEVAAPHGVLITVRIAGKHPDVAETTEQLVQSKYLQTSKIAYLSNLMIEQLGELLVAFRKSQSTKWSWTAAIQLATEYVSKHSRIASTGPPRWTARRIVRAFANLGLIDSEGYVTSYGNRLCKDFLGDKEKFRDSLAQLLLVSGGWVAVLTELNTIYKEAGDLRMKDLLELLHDRLEQAKFMKGKWSSEAMIEVLLDLKLIGQWDSVKRCYPVSWERINALMKARISP
jgi:hypothetical protein